MQEEIVQDILGNRDVFVLMPTGSGKKLLGNKAVKKLYLGG